MLTAIPVVLAPPALTIAQERQVRFHVPSFFLPAICFTAQDHPAIGSAATIRTIDASAVTVWSERTSRIRFIFCFLSAHRLEHFPFRPPIEVLNRGNSAFITVFVVETDNGTASPLIGAPNTFHARTTHNLIGRCAAERAFLALRLDVCFHLLLPPYNTPCNNP